MPRRECESDPRFVSLPQLRFEVAEAARILRISRAQLYNRIQEGLLRPQKDGARTYITRAELKRYVESCNLPRSDGRLREHPTSAQRPQRSERVARARTRDETTARS